MSRVRFHQWAAIERHLHESYDSACVLRTGPGWEAWDDEKANVVNAYLHGRAFQAHAIVTYDVDDLDGCGLPVVMQFNEAFNYERVESRVRRNGARLVIFHHENDLPRYRHHFEPRGIQCEHIHHCVDTSVFKDYGLPKDIDVLVAGNLNDHYYPFRARLRDIAFRILRKRGYRVHVQPHPGYTLPPREGTVTGEDFAKLLNRARIVFTCSMRYNYALAKYSEIAACRALPCGDLPAERKAFFERTVLQVEPTMLDEDIVRIVEHALDTEGVCERLTTQAHDLTRQTSTMGVYAEKFHQAVKAMLKDL